jgi:hypothetical protein
VCGLGRRAGRAGGKFSATFGDSTTGNRDSAASHGDAPARHSDACAGHSHSTGRNGNAANSAGNDSKHRTAGKCSRIEFNNAPNPGNHTQRFALRTVARNRRHTERVDTGAARGNTGHFEFGIVEFRVVKLRNIAVNRWK